MTASEVPEAVTNGSIDEQIYRIPKGQLRNCHGLLYSEFKRGLNPRYFVVWRDIALGHATLVAGAMALIQCQKLWPGAWSIFIVAGALFFGFTLAFLNLFMHEATHNNLAKSSKVNDWLADWTIGIFFGQSIQAYRTVHFGHHQHHGTTMDTEHSYFDPLNMHFVVGGLFGIRAFRVARKRNAIVSSGSKVPPGAQRNALLRGLILNGAIVGCSLITGYWTLGIAWTAGVLSIYPLLNALRQFLEHRDEWAPDNVDYAETEHGRINRLFGDSVFAQTFGGAGFNRHLLHHWEPNVSYTRLRDLERFLMDCDCAPLFQHRQTTYGRLLVHFLRKSFR